MLVICFSRFLTSARASDSRVLHRPLLGGQFRFEVFDGFPRILVVAFKFQQFHAQGVCLIRVLTIGFYGIFVGFARLIDSRFKLLLTLAFCRQLFFQVCVFVPRGGEARIGLGQRLLILGNARPLHVQPFSEHCQARCQSLHGCPKCF